MKTCNKCGIAKEVTEFRIQKRGEKEYLRGECRECGRAASKKWHAEAGRDFDLKYRYGITSEQYDAMLEAQNGGCAVCGNTEPGRGNKYFCVDHDHACCSSQDKTCGRCVRGLLCHNCNVILGLAGDNKDRLMGLVAYLIQNENKEVSA